jgi:ATP-dependent Clp protease, protease subunit
VLRDHRTVKRELSLASSLGRRHVPDERAGLNVGCARPAVATIAASISTSTTGRPVPDEIEKLLGGTRRAFDKLFEQRIVFLKGQLDDELTDAIVAQLLALDADSDEDITMYVNSPGGIITGMFAIYDTMRLLSSRVHTRCIGLAASAGAFLLGTGTGSRSSTENARIMIHQPAGGARGTAKDIEIQAKNIVWMRERINEILAARTGQTVDKIRLDTDRDYWMTAGEALTYGLIDEIVEPGRGS